MNPDNRFGNDGLRRSLSSLDCLCLTALLGSLLTEAERRDFLAPHIRYGWEDHLNDATWVLLTLHRICHRENSLSAAVSEFLDRRCEKQLSQIRQISPEAELDSWVRSACAVRDEVPLLGWALLSQREAAHHEQGQYLAHEIIRRGLRTTLCKHEQSEAMEAAGEMLDLVFLPYESLQKRVWEQERTIEQMLDYICKTRGLNESEAVNLARLLT